MPRFGITIKTTVYTSFVITANTEGEAETLGSKKVYEGRDSRKEINWSAVGFPDYKVIVDPLDEAQHGTTVAY